MKVRYRSCAVAQTKGRPPQKEEESKGKRPDYVIRCRQAPDSDFYLTIGAAWRVQVNGEDAFSIKLTSIPTNWGGSALMLVPKDE
jgi:hypothetical protein